MKKYLMTLSTVVIIILAVIALFNWLIDPFDFLSSPRLEGVNIYKPKIRSRITKVYKTYQIKPATIILGSSRGLNIPSDHPLYVNKPVYNLALESGSGYEMFRMFQHAHAVNPLKTVIIGLDEGFSNATYINFSENRFAVTKYGAPNYKRFMQYWRDAYNSLISIDAIRASVSTIKKQPYYSVKNFAKIDMQKRVYNAGGHHQMFLSLENRYLDNLKSINQCLTDLPLPNVFSIKNQLENLNYFNTMLEIAYRDNIDFKIFFSPIHARHQEIYCINGSGFELEAFKYSIVSLVESVAKKYNKKPFLVMDFSGYNRITTESLPALGDKNTLMQFYWEGSHYTTATAKIMLDKLLENGNKTFKDDFGVALNMNNIIAHFITQRKRHVLYSNTHPSDIAEIMNRAKQKLKNKEN